MRDIPPGPSAGENNDALEEDTLFSYFHHKHYFLGQEVKSSHRKTLKGDV